jgi:hypothetical protein
MEMEGDSEGDKEGKLTLTFRILFEWAFSDCGFKIWGCGAAKDLGGE